MTRAAKRRPVRSRRSAPRFSWRVSPTAWWRSGVVLTWCGTLVLLAWGLGALEQYVVAAQPTGSTHLVWHELPAWLSDPAYAPVLADIEAAADLRPEDDLHDPSLAAYVGERLADNPWVAEVQRVAKRADGAVIVSATFRQPMAYVTQAGQAYLVDRTGVRLPNQCRVAGIRNDEWFQIVGVSGTRPEVGQRWQGDDLAAGLALVEYLEAATRRAEVPFRSWLTTVDVANFFRREREFDGRLRIRTVRPDCYINWGEPPGSEYPVEAPAARKLELIRAVYQQHGELPDAVLDVRGEDGVR